MRSAHVRVHVLQRKLDMIEPDFLQPREAGAIEPDRRGDQVGVEPGVARGCDDLDQVAPRRGFAAGQMDLQHAHRGRLAKHARPCRGVQFIGAIVRVSAGSSNTGQARGQRCVSSASSPSGAGSSAVASAGSRTASASSRVRPACRSRRLRSPRDRRCRARQAHRRSGRRCGCRRSGAGFRCAGPSVSITRSGPSSTHAPRVVSKCRRTPGARRGRSGSRLRHRSPSARRRQAGSARA